MLPWTPYVSRRLMRISGFEINVNIVVALRPEKKGTRNDASKTSFLAPFGPSAIPIYRWRVFI